MNIDFISAVSYRSIAFDSSVSPLSLSLNELQRPLSRNRIDSTDVARKSNTIAFLCHPQHLRPERCADELPSTTLLSVAVTLPTLPALRAIGRCRREGVQMLGDGRAILRIEVGVDFVEDIERGWVGGLDGKD